MTEHKMTDEKRKMLTELLGERWHVPYRFWDYGCGMMREVTNRTFTTDADMMAVFRKIKDKGKLSKFDMFCQDIFLEYTGYDNICDMCNEYRNWLFLDNPERACCLAAMWLEEQG